MLLAALVLEGLFSPLAIQKGVLDAWRFRQEGIFFGESDAPPPAARAKARHNPTQEICDGDDSSPTFQSPLHVFMQLILVSEK